MLGALFVCCVVPESCYTNYAIERFETVAHPTKGNQAVVYRSNAGAMASIGYHVVIGRKGWPTYWRSAQIAFYDGNAPKLSWSGDTLRIDIMGKTHPTKSRESVVVSGQRIEIELFKNGERLSMNK